MSARPDLRIVKPRRRRKNWPVSPKLPALDVSKLTPEQSRRLAQIACRSGVAWHPTKRALLSRMLRAFVGIFFFSVKAKGGAVNAADQKGR